MKKNLLFGASLLAFVFINNDLLCNVKEIGSKEEFNRAVKDSKKLVVVKLYLNGCPHCESLAPKFLALSNDEKLIQDAEFIAVEYNKVPQIAVNLNVRSFPTVIYFKKGQEISRAKKADQKSIKEDIARLK